VRYRPALGFETALNEFTTRRESAYDPWVADACLPAFNETGYKIEV
jgi:hypothetical protein